MTREGLYKGDSYAGGPNVTAGFSSPPPFRTSRSHQPPGSQYPNGYQLPHRSHSLDSYQNLPPTVSQNPPVPREQHHTARQLPCQPDTDNYADPGHQNKSVPRKENPFIPENPSNSEKTGSDGQSTEKTTRGDKVSTPTQRCTKDEKRLREAGVQLNIKDVIGLPMEDFNSLLSQAKMTEQQQELCRDVRKRGKNKWAAQNCRKRKIDQLDELSERLMKAQQRRNKLREDHERLLLEYEKEANKLNNLNEAVLHYHRKDPLHFIVQVQDGDVVKVLPKHLVREEDRVPQPVEKYRQIFAKLPDSEPEANTNKTQPESINTLENIENLEFDPDLNFLIQAP